ncbi:uncharacterized protein LDX57_010805 [Aspergillus melleus]|uniref:uncharacterized protein n=1 Tax=Aspergillus melleus TaxID=138277 RepID=UPI001E8E1CC9|nr:uncharacterized protein LDX57_010805 [Aspergillus melleus]KAH8433171.1 hypothetical protein LDX57_010805 [Aspergillus melleus]
MPRRLTPRSAKQRERQFWNWTRLGWTARQREEFFELLIERLYASGILVLDLRKLQNRLSVELFLRRQLDSIGTELDGEPDGWDDLYEAKGKELLRRVRVALVARKREYLAQMKAQGNPVRPDRPEEVIHREFNQAYETDSDGTSSPGSNLSHRKGDPHDRRNGRWIYLQNDFPTDSELERQPQSYLGASLQNAQVADTQESNSQGEEDNQEVASSSSRGVWSDNQGGIDTPVERDSPPLFSPEPAQHYTEHDEIPETQGSGPPAEEVDSSESPSSVSHHNDIPDTQVSSSPADQYNVEDDSTESPSSVSGPDEIPDSQGPGFPAEEDQAEEHPPESPSSVSDHDEIPDSQEPGPLEEEDSLQLVAAPEFGPAD